MTKRRKKLTECDIRHLTPAELRVLKRQHRIWIKRLKPLFDAVRASERITAKDLSIIVREA